MTDIEKTGTHEEELTILYEDNHLLVVNKRCGDRGLEAAEPRVLPRRERG